MEMSNQYCVPPGFRFHPTEEELVGYYLKRKVESKKCDLDHVIVDIDIYRMEPWEIECRCKLGYEDENEWFFFGYKDRKYPTGNRTNRATALGFWKATGRDKPVFSSVSGGAIIGMRKTLVFYKGRAPNGIKTNWIIHEYRLQHPSRCHTREDGWVVCRAFKKPSPLQNRGVIGRWTNYGHYYNNNNNNNNGTSFKPTSPESGLDQQATCSDYRLPIIGSDQSFSSSSSRLYSDEVLELPPINSPMTITTSTAATSRDRDFENGISCDWYMDWENIEDILGSKSIDPDPHPHHDAATYEQIDN